MRLRVQALEIYISIPKLPLLVSEVVPNPVEDALALLMSLTVSVTDLKLKGRARLTLRPLLERMPVVGGTRIALIRPPDFEYNLNLGCGEGWWGVSAWGQRVGSGFVCVLQGLAHGTESFEIVQDLRSPGLHVPWVPAARP